MDFALLPPEVNSGRMYAGAGSGSMMAAAAAWDGLASELQSAASSYGSVLSGLTNEWSGPASASMTAAAAPYVTWMSTTAAQAQQAGAQARAAATAYETAFAATVPPPEIAANRAQLTSLVATNILGQNTAAIAATEAQYGAMWAQDAAAMYGYAASSAAAAQVTSFTAPAQITNPGGQAGQAAAVAQATGTSAATNVQTALSQLTSEISQALANLSSTVSTTASTIGPTGILTSLTGSSTASSIYSSLFTIGSSVDKFILPANDVLISIIFGLVQFKTFFSPATAALGSLLPSLGAGLTSATGALGSAGLGTTVSTISAGMGSSGLVGGLSVPTSWASATPAVRMLAASLQGTGLGAAPAAMAGESGSLLSSMGLASMAGGAIGRATPQVAFSSIKGSNKPARVDHLVAELSKQPDNSAVQHWNTDSAGLEKLLAELAQKPGIHAVHLASDKKPKIASPKF